MRLLCCSRKEVCLSFLSVDFVEMVQVNMCVFISRMLELLRVPAVLSYSTLCISYAAGMQSNVLYNL